MKKMILVGIILSVLLCSCEQPPPVVVITYGPELEAFTLASHTYADSRYGESSTIYNGYLYVTGGYTSTYANDVQYSAINADGDLAGFASTSSFINGRTRHVCVAYNGYMYIIGGLDGVTGALTSVEYAPINGDGTVGTFSAASNSLNTERYSFAAVAYNGYLYVFGGVTNATNTRSVEYAAIGPGGDLGGFTELTNQLNIARYFCGGTVYNGYVYIAGGRETGSTDYDTVEYALLSPTGGVGTFTTSPNAFLTAREFAPVIGYADYLYIVGGSTVAGASDVFDDIQYAAIDPATGEIGTFTTAAETLLADTTQHSLCIHNNVLYSVGGQYLTTTAYAPFVQN